MQSGRHPASTSIIVGNLEPALEEQLRVRAAQHGQSMEAEVLVILRAALGAEKARPQPHLYERIRARFAPLGGVDLDLPPREPAREPPPFS